MSNREFVCDSVQDSVEELTKKIYHERSKIIDLLAQMRDVSPTGSQNVFEDCVNSDRCTLEYFQKPENLDALLTVGNTSVEEKLLLELEASGYDLQLATEQLRKKEKKLERELERKNVLQEPESRIKPINNENIDVIEQNLKKRFQKEKNQLKKLLGSLFPEDEAMKSLLGELMGLVLKEPEAYVTVREEDKARIVLLTKSGLFEQHPDDPLKIRTVNLF